MEEFILPDLSYQEQQDDLIKDEIRIDMGEITVKSEILENNQDLTSDKVSAINNDKSVLNVDIRLPFRCPKCPKSFMKSNILQKHFQTHTSGLSEHVCDVCYLSLPNAQELATHKKTHKKPLSCRPYSCSFCGTVFRNTFKMEEHVRVSHTRERPFKCTICPKRFLVQTCLKRHILVHTGEKPHLCQICGRGFGDKSSLSGHVRTQHNPAEKKPRKKPEKRKVTKSVGNVSGQNSTNSESLINKETFSSLKSQTTSGEVCFNSVQISPINIDDVDIRRPFRCPTCTKSFMKSNILQKHLHYYHTPGFSGLNGKLCDVCYEVFPTDGELTDHIIKTHSKSQTQETKIQGEIPLSLIRSTLQAHDTKLKGAK